MDTNWNQMEFSENRFDPTKRVTTERSEKWRERLSPGMPVRMVMLPSGEVHYMRCVSVGDSGNPKRPVLVTLDPDPTIKPPPVPQYAGPSTIYVSGRTWHSMEFTEHTVDFSKPIVTERAEKWRERIRQGDVIKVARVRDRVRAFMRVASIEESGVSDRPLRVTLVPEPGLSDQHPDHLRIVT